MARPSKAASELSPAAHAQLTRLGEHLGVAVKTRETYKDFSERLGVSAITLRKLIAGDPGVSLGTFVAALDALSLLDHLDDVAAPEHDSLGQGLRIQTKRTGVGYDIDRNF